MGYGNIPREVLQIASFASAANRYFDTTDAIGKTVETNDNGNTVYEVTAIIEDMPRNSHFRFDMLFSMKNVRYGDWGEILSHNFNTYLLLQPRTDRKKLEAESVCREILPACGTRLHADCEHGGISQTG